MIKVSFIGSGNVATHLALGLDSAGVEIVEIYSPTPENAASLASKVGAMAVLSIKDVCVSKVDVIIVSVKDDRIQDVANALDKTETLIAHTSGTKSVGELSEHVNSGVFYPLQTFSKESDLDLSNIPFCVEGSNNKSLNTLKKLANLLSKDVRLTTEETRKSIHVAAVVACNFSNHMFALAEKLLLESGADLSILKPLIQETVLKALNKHPKDVQTGPAIREDHEVLKNHLIRLNGSPDLQKLYQDISNSIIKLKHE